MSNQQKSNFARAAPFFCTFLCHCFARLQGETSRNFLVTRFMEELLYVFAFTIFTVAHFHLALVVASIIFSFCHCHYQIFMLFFQQRKASSVFYLSLQISVALFLIELCWPAAYFLFLSVFLWLYNNIYYSKFVDMTVDLSLMLQTRRIQKQFLLSIFVFIDSQLSLLYKMLVAMGFPSKITLICIWVAIPAD